MVEIGSVVSDSDLAFASKRPPSEDEKGAFVYQNNVLSHVYSEQYNANDSAKDIRMDREYYQIEVLFQVADTEHNYEGGNLYLQSVFNSTKKSNPSLTLARYGYLDPKGSLTMYVKEFLNLIPMSQYVPGLATWDHMVAIRIFETFDNKDFSAESIEFLLSN
jgi:hypothetical protein